MKKSALVGTVAVIFVLTIPVCGFASEPEWQDIGKGISQVTSVLLIPGIPNRIYIGTSDGVFKTDDSGASWRMILTINGKNKGVNFLFSDPRDKSALFAATSQGLYQSDDAGGNWSRIFKGKNPREDECVALGISSSRIYLGTNAGLFASDDKGKIWRRESGKIGTSPVCAIAYDKDEAGRIYVACHDGVFRMREREGNWERIFVSSASEDGNNAPEDAEETSEEERPAGIKHVCVEPGNRNIYIATGKGIYKSRNEGRTWEAMSVYGLLSQDTRFVLAAGKDALYAVTKSGIFEYKGERWQELSLNLMCSGIAFLARDDSGSLYAACDKGLYMTNPKNLADNQNSIGRFYAKGEPKIREVQEAAIRYAEVQPEKIRRWREQAAKKALLPQVSVGVDRNTTDLWHWEGGSTTKEGDDNLRRGRDSIDWAVALTWDLGELIWNEDQTNIDVRSKLMAELREGILDEVTRTYFERLRVKMELDGLGIEDRKKRAEKELKLQELAASLDALTGGYFSARIK